MKNVKVEWCENFIKARFTKHHPFPNSGIQDGCFWNMAERAGLWERGTYGSPMSIALSNLCTVESVLDQDGNYCYTVFRMVQP